MKDKNAVVKGEVVGNKRSKGDGLLTFAPFDKPVLTKNRIYFACYRCYPFYVILDMHQYKMSIDAKLEEEELAWQ